MELTDSKDYKQLVVTGEATADECAEAWEKIVQRNAEQAGELGYRHHLNNYKTFVQLLADYNAVKATLHLLLYRLDDGNIEWLRKKGFKLDVAHGQQAFEDSLTNAIRKSDNIMNRLRMKQNELMLNNKEEKTKPFGFEELMANLTYSLGFEVANNITVVRYNEYIKQIARRNKANEPKTKK